MHLKASSTSIQAVKHLSLPISFPLTIYHTSDTTTLIISSFVISILLDALLAIQGRGRRPP